MRVESKISAPSIDSANPIARTTAASRPDNLISRMGSFLAASMPVRAGLADAVAFEPRAERRNTKKNKVAPSAGLGGSFEDGSKPEPDWRDCSRKPHFSIARAGLASAE